ncbi:MAG: hypothetical protein ACAH83_20545 [Alphaproteobacteria bacterium]
MILTFAAACAGLTGCDGAPPFKFLGGSSKPTPAATEQQVLKIDASRLTPEQRTLYRQASEAALYQKRTADLKKELDEKHITKEVYDQGVKENDDQIIQRRQQYVGTPTLALFDAFFRNELRVMGIAVPEKLPEAPKVVEQPTPEAGTPPAPVTSPEPQAQNLKPGSQQILEALAPLIGEMLAGGAQPIGPGAPDAALGGVTTREEIFPGGPIQNNTRIKSSALQSGQKYVFEGKLTIDGDLPPNVTLNVLNGKLVLNGNAGAGSVIKVQQPSDIVGGQTVGGGTHPEKYPCYNNAAGPSQGRPSDYSYHYGYRQDGCTKDVPNATKTVGGHEELRYKDTDPAIKITGTAAADAQITTNAGGKVTIDGGRAPVKKVAASQPANP